MAATIESKRYRTHLNESSIKAGDGDKGDFGVSCVIREYPMRYGSGYDLVKPVARKRIPIDSRIFPTGKDDGKGAARMLQTYSDHVLDLAQLPIPHPFTKITHLADDFIGSIFDEKLASTDMKGIPLQSSIRMQKKVIPKNTSEEKKFFIVLHDRLRDDDPSLVRARLNNMQINDFVITQLASGIVRNTYLKYLMLHNNHITDHGAETLCKSLQYHPNCHSLWIGNNRITDIGLRHIAELCSWNPNLKELNVSNRWPTEIGAKKAIEMHPHVSFVGAEHLARFLPRGSGLTSLSLCYQRLRDDGAILLFGILSDVPLRSLNLSANELSDRCCDTLQSVLPANPILEELILSRNHIKDPGAMAIAYGLAFNSLLLNCDLSYNEIEMTGLYALFRCLEFNTTVASLVTVGNKFEDHRADNVAATRNNSIFALPPAAGLAAPFASVVRNRRKPSHAEVRKSLALALATTSVSEGDQENEKSDKDDADRDQHHREPLRSFVDLAQSPFQAAPERREFAAYGVETHGRKSMSRSLLQTEGSKEVTIEEAIRLAVLAVEGADNKNQNRKTRRRGESVDGDGDRDRDGDENSVGSVSSSGSINSAKSKGSIVSIKSAGSIGSSNSGMLLSDLVKARKEKLSFSSKSKAARRLSSTANPFSLPPDKRAEYFKRKAAASEMLPEDKLKAFVEAQKPQKRLSQDLGKTIGIPKLTSHGVKPIRSSITPYADSDSHLLYLRVSTEDDPEGTRPTSIIQIALDREAERERVKKERQSKLYRNQKAIALKRKPTKASSDSGSVIKIPDKFWRDWDYTMKNRYPRGIDKSKGCESTKLEPLVIPPPPTDSSLPDEYKRFNREDPGNPWNRFLAHSKDEKLAYQKHLGFRKRVFTPGEILAARRKEILARKEAILDNKLLSEQSAEAERAIATDSAKPNTPNQKQQSAAVTVTKRKEVSIIENADGKNKKSALSAHSKQAVAPSTPSSKFVRIMTP